jgi:hypothetical protein
MLHGGRPPYILIKHEDFKQRPKRKRVARILLFLIETKRKKATSTKDETDSQAAQAHRDKCYGG